MQYRKFAKLIKICIKTLAGPEYTYEIINIFFRLSFYNELIYQIYSRSKATAKIRFAQKTRWPPKNVFFRFVIL